jgi:hypothetical protein
MKEEAGATVPSREESEPIPARSGADQEKEEQDNNNNSKTSAKKKVVQRPVYFVGSLL